MPKYRLSRAKILAHDLVQHPVPQKCLSNMSTRPCTIRLMYARFGLNRPLPLTEAVLGGGDRTADDVPCWSCLARVVGALGTGTLICSMLLVRSKAMIFSKMRIMEKMLVSSRQIWARSSSLVLTKNLTSTRSEWNCWRGWVGGEVSVGSSEW